MLLRRRGGEVAARRSRVRSRSGPHPAEAQQVEHQVGQVERVRHPSQAHDIARLSRVPLGFDQVPDVLLMSDDGAQGPMPPRDDKPSRRGAARERPGECAKSVFEGFGPLEHTASPGAAGEPLSFEQVPDLLMPDDEDQGSAAGPMPPRYEEPSRRGAAREHAASAGAAGERRLSFDQVPDDLVMSDDGAQGTAADRTSRRDDAPSRCGTAHKRTASPGAAGDPLRYDEVPDQLSIPGDSPDDDPPVPGGGAPLSKKYKVFDL